MFLHLPLKVGYNSRKFGMTLIWQKLHNMQECSWSCQHRGKVAGLTSVSVRQVKSKDGLAQMIETMHFVW